MPAYSIFFDGACGPQNPGGIATWGIIVNCDGHAIHSDWGCVGAGPRMSSNVAEWYAAHRALDYIQSEHLKSATIYGDSQLVINRMKQRQISKGLCRPYSIDAVQALILIPAQISFVWIPRESNHECDALTEMAYEEFMSKNPDDSPLVSDLTATSGLQGASVPAT